MNWPTAFALVGGILALSCLFGGFPVINIGCRTHHHHYGDDGGDDIFEFEIAPPPPQYHEN